MTEEKILTGKKVLIGITGGIGAYKTYTVIRELVKDGAEVQVVLTKSAKEFISPVTLRTFTGHPVYDSLFGTGEITSAAHIELSRWADCFLICPATANIIGKAAHGIGDDLLSTVLISYERPVMFVPAMNTRMYENPIVQENIKKLLGLGYIFIGPESGDMATLSEGTGMGRLISEEIIIETVRRFLLAKIDLKGYRVLVTAGRTVEPIDPVRYISNHSSGRMGFAMAEEAVMRGAEVTLIMGDHDIQPPSHIHTIPIKTANEMARAVSTEWQNHDILIMAAAVADYKADHVASQKLKRNDEQITLNLVRNEDIIAAAAKNKGGKLVIGFALETEHDILHAQEKLRQKGLDMIVVNNPNEPGAGFGTDTNKVTIISPENEPESIPLMSKRKVAGVIWDRIQQLLHKKTGFHHAAR